VDDSWKDEPLCSVEAPPEPKGSHPAAAAPTPDTSQRPGVTDPPSTMPATTTPDSKCSHPTAVAPTPDVPQGPVADPPSTTLAATPPASRCPTPILPWTPDQDTPTTPITPPALYRRLYRGEQVSQGSPYQPLSPTENFPLPGLVKDAGRATRSGARHDRLMSVPREGDAAEKTLTVTERGIRHRGPCRPVSTTDAARSLPDPA